MPLCHAVFVGVRLSDVFIWLIVCLCYSNVANTLILTYWTYDEDLEQQSKPAYSWKMKEKRYNFHSQ